MAASRKYSEVAVKMKEFEKATDMRVDPTKPWIIRLDGHHFSRFTKGWQKPFDQRSMSIIPFCTLSVS
jgi:tRNA(His) 5'-end guanylyltransferase